MAQDDLTTEQLLALPSAYIVVRRRRFRLEVHLRAGYEYVPHMRCPIAVGAIGHTTPGGPHMVFKKESPPTYTAPDSQWARDAGYTPGQKMAPDDPANPVRGAFLWLTEDGVGIHGTANLLSLRSRASHGCIRVREADAVRIYRLVPVGSPVYVL